MRATGKGEKKMSYGISDWWLIMTVLRVGATVKAPVLSRPVVPIRSRLPSVVVRCASNVLCMGPTKTQCSDSGSLFDRSESSRSDSFATGFILGGVIFGALGFLFAPQVSFFMEGCSSSPSIISFIASPSWSSCIHCRSAKPCWVMTSGSSYPVSSRRRRTQSKPGRTWSTRLHRWGEEKDTLISFQIF